ncbi:OmpH family outer membrane protein [Tenacibaculum amylolyticum]|uniref:OmpH family outer membrane protein n=1 Tax=Tenacibaculum amylolyticum TaxID=104269 RepID=UPI003894E78B
MKLKITFSILIATVFTLNAQQTKLGTINTNYIIGKMPQMKTVLKRVDKYGKELDSILKIKATEYNEKATAYRKEVATLDEAAKKEKGKELLVLEQELGQFRQNGASLIKIRQEEYMRPIYKKISEVIAEVAKENGYTQILTSDGNEFGYLDPTFDITKLVLAKLGIKE